VKTLIVGGGGREHALAWAISQSPRVSALFAAPGNGGTDALGTNVDIAADDIDALCSFAGEHEIDLTVVGPEAPLVAGIVDRFRSEGLVCYGPVRDAARLEGSKVFAKEFMARHNIPTAPFDVCATPEEARDAVARRGTPVVIKADGLAAGKGVVVARSVEQAHDAIESMMVSRSFGDAGARVVIEDCLDGEEVSVHAVCAGERALLLPGSQDHKRAFDGDEGPNTGGMGAYAPVPSFRAEDMERAREQIFTPTLNGLRAEGVTFTGTLYAGLMRTADGFRVLEFNVRFGDPETQVLMPMIRGDAFSLLYGAARGELPLDVAVYDDRAAVAVVVAAQGYPGEYRRGMEITGWEQAESEKIIVFHAGTRREDGRLVTSGGRVVAVTAWDRHLTDAVASAYRAVDRIHFEGAVCRRDIGHRALGS